MLHLAVDWHSMCLELDTFKVTLTRCLGAKFDASAGFGFSVRYLLIKDELLESRDMAILDSSNSRNAHS